jgi:O-methyltransferase
MIPALARARAISSGIPIFPESTFEELLGDEADNVAALWEFGQALLWAGKFIDSLYVWHRIKEIGDAGQAELADQNIRHCHARLDQSQAPTYDRRPLKVSLNAAGFRFDRKFQSAIHNGLEILRENDPEFDAPDWALHVLVWAARHALRLEGDFVECGVFLGLGSRVVCEYLGFADLPRKFYLFDTFSGGVESMALPEEKWNHDRQGYMAGPGIYERAVRQFEKFPNVELVRGIIPASLTSVSIEKVAYLHIDMNMTAPEIAAINYFWDKLSPGACVVLDDYARSPYYKQQEAMDDFARSRGVSICYLPTGQGLLLKP